MFIKPTPEGHHVLDEGLVVPNAVVPTFVNTCHEDEVEPEPNHEDPFLLDFDEESSYYDDLLDFYCGQHVHDEIVSG